MTEVLEHCDHEALKLKTTCIIVLSNFSFLQLNCALFFIVFLYNYIHVHLIIEKFKTTSNCNLFYLF